MGLILVLGTNLAYVSCNFWFIAYVFIHMDKKKMLKCLCTSMFEFGGGLPELWIEFGGLLNIWLKDLAIFVFLNTHDIIFF